MITDPEYAVILLAAGSGSRMRGTVRDKVLTEIEGRSVFGWSRQAFQEALGDAVCHWIVTFQSDTQRSALEAVAPQATFVPGGARRQDSVHNALQALAPVASPNLIVFIHDAARPLIHPETIRASAAATAESGSGCVARPEINTLQQAPINTDPTAAPVHLEPLDRSRLWAMETPQTFVYSEICDAYVKAQQEGATLTDDASAFAFVGHPIRLVENRHANLKLTRPDDLEIIAAELRRRNQ